MAGVARVTEFREAFPILYVADVARSVDFYVTTLGFAQTYRFPPEGELRFAFLRLDPLGIGIARRDPAKRGDFELCIYTDDVDAGAEQLRAAGADEIAAPADQEWGERLTYFRDLDGNLLHVTQKLKA